MSDLYRANAWVWLVQETGRYWSSADRAYSDAAPAEFTPIATETELRAVLTAAGSPEHAPGSMTSAPAGATVALWQAKEALRQLGKLDAANALVAATDSPALHLAWEYANDVSRNSPAVTAIGAALGLDNAALDNLFARAAIIRV